MISDQTDFSAFDDLIAKAPEAADSAVTVTTQVGIPAMSSLEIARITGKEHRNVMADIRRILEEAEIGLLRFEQSYRNAQNKEQPCFVLPRRECDLVVSGYSVKYRLAIIDRWHELEAKQSQQAFALPRTMSEALRLAADLQDQVEVLAPKAAALDVLAEAGGSVCITDAAKLLQIRPKQLFAWLDSHGWTFRRPGSRAGRVPYQSKVTAGLMELKAHAYECLDGTRQVAERALVTAKGLTVLAQKISHP